MQSRMGSIPTISLIHDDASGKPPPGCPCGWTDPEPCSAPPVTAGTAIGPGEPRNRIDKSVLILDHWR